MNLPININADNLINDLKVVCWQASDILLNYSHEIRNKQYKNNFIRLKETNEPVTLADIEVNNLIISYLNKKYLNIDWNILSEENIIEKSNKKIAKQWLWVLDPLDGTKDFIQNTGNYAMHLALNHKDKPFIGIVLIPAKNQLWISNGEKVWCENSIGRKTKPSLSNIKVLSDMKLVTSMNHKNQSLEKIINNVGFKEVIAMGSIGCKIASILRGEADIYISLSLPGQSSPKDWDFAAPEAILRKAGGRITNINNEMLSFNKKDFKQEGLIVATSNKANHKNICSQLKEIIQKNNILIN